MVGLQIIVRTTEGKRREFVQAFGMLTRPESRNTACLCQELYEEADRSNRFLWLEYWSDMRSLRDYLGSTRFRTVLGAIDVVGSRDDIKIMEIHEHAGGAAGGGNEKDLNGSGKGVQGAHTSGPLSRPDERSRE